MCILAAKAAVLDGNAQVIQDIARLFNAESKCDTFKKVAHRHGVRIRKDLVIFNSIKIIISTVF